jgi:DNA topoisomerase-1
MLSPKDHGQYGEKYVQPRKFKNKNESAQEAHEAIRPTYMDAMTVEDADCRRLYELIWKRTMASQMADAELEKTTAKIQISTNKEELTASGEVLEIRRVPESIYGRPGRRRDHGRRRTGRHAAPLAVKQQLPLERNEGHRTFQPPLPRYTEASLVKKLEELGIGRPSTYAPTISTILKRGYVEKRDKEGVKTGFQDPAAQKRPIEKGDRNRRIPARKSPNFPHRSRAGGDRLPEAVF